MRSRTALPVVADRHLWLWVGVGAAAVAMAAVIYAALGVLSSGGQIDGPQPGEGVNRADHVFDSLAVDPLDPQRLYLGSEGNGIFKSTDGGRTWVRLRAGLRYGDFARWYPEVYAVVVNPRRPEIVYAATSNGPGPAAEVIQARPSLLAGVYKSLNGGAVWKQMNAALPNSAVTALDLSPSAPDTLLAGVDGGGSGGFGAGGLYLSTDGGGRWLELTLPPPARYNRFVKVKVCNGQPPLMFAAGVHYHAGTEIPTEENSVGLLRSANGGKSWQPVNPPQVVIAHFDAAADGRTVYAADVGHGRLFRSVSGGIEWEELPLAGVGPIRISPADPRVIFFARGRELYRSTDGMASWSLVLTSSGGAIEDIEIAAADPAVVYAAAAGLRVYRSADGGQTFEETANLRLWLDGGAK